MSFTEAFPREELDNRLKAVQSVLCQKGFDGCVVSVPENIYYLTGLNHWGYFACHVLIVPSSGQPTLVCRAMERIAVNNMVHNADFVGYADHDEPGIIMANVISNMKLNKGKLGIEKNSLFLTPKIYEQLVDATPQVQWNDFSKAIDTLRFTQSSLEQQYTRKAAMTSDAAMQAAIDAIRVGGSDLEIAGASHNAMMLAGSEYPGFGPFIRTTGRLGEEHTTWCGDTINHGSPVFLELTGSVQRYQAPMGRMVFAGAAPAKSDFIENVCIDGFNAMIEALHPGALFGEIYSAWHNVVSKAGFPNYHRQHSGYLTGISFPPSWTGGSMVTSLAPESKMEIKAGMAFHLHSWLTETGKGDYWISNTVLLTDKGCEVLTKTPMQLQVR